MDDEPIADTSELIQLCFVGLVGANNEIDKVLKDFHEKYDKPSGNFLFCEYLLHQPLHMGESNNRLESTWEFSPFLPRLARKSLVMVRAEDASGKKPSFNCSTDEDVAKACVLIRLSKTFHTQYVYKYWDNLKRGEGKN